MTIQKEIRTYKGHTDWVFTLDVKPAAKRLVSGGFDGEVKVLNTESGECLKSFRAMPGLKTTAR